MSRPHVVWTQREWVLIAEWFVHNHINPEARGLSTALSEAQDNKLPADRRRSMIGLGIGVRRRVKEAMAAVQKRLDNLPPPTGPVVFVPDPPAAKMLSTEELLVELARRIARLLEPAKVEHPEDRGFHPKHDPCPKGDVRVGKPKVLIVGPDSVAQERLAKDFAGSLALRFVGYQDNPALIGTRCDQAVTIACVTRFISHAQQEAAKATKIPVKLVSTIQELRAWLSTL